MKKIAVLAATAALVALSAQAATANPISDATTSFFQGFTVNSVPARGDELVDGVRVGAPNANGLTFGANVPARGDELVNGNRVGEPKAFGLLTFGANVPAR